MKGRDDEATKEGTERCDEAQACIEWKQSDGAAKCKRRGVQVS